MEQVMVNMKKKRKQKMKGSECVFGCFDNCPKKKNVENTLTASVSEIHTCLPHPFDVTTEISLFPKKQFGSIGEKKNFLGFDNNS